MMILIKNILNGLRKEKKQCIGIIGILVLSTILIGTLFNVNIAIGKNVDKIINKGNQQDFYFIVNGMMDKEESKKLSEKYNFSYEERSYKNVEDTSLNKKSYFKFLKPTKNINIPIVVEGNMPAKNNEIAVNTNFAYANEYKLGDTIEINQKKYKLSAIVVIPDYISPIVKINSTVYNSKTEALVIPTEEEFNLVEADLISSYSAKFKDSLDENKVKAMKNDESFLAIVFNEDNFSINTIQSKMTMNEIIIVVSMVCLISIVVLMLVLFLSKKINNDKEFLGVMKAHGIKTYKIAIAYCSYSIVTVIPSVILGYLVSLILSPMFEKSYNYGFSIMESVYKFDIGTVAVLVLVPLLLMMYTTVICIYWNLRKKPIELLNEQESSTVSKVTNLMGKIIKHNNFLSVLKMNFIMGNKKLILLCIFGAYCVGLQMILSINLYKMPNNMITEEFKGRNYAYDTRLLESNTLDINISGEYEEYYSANGNITSVNKANTEKETSIEINLMALSSSSKMLELYEKDEKINSYLDKGLIINEVLMAGYGLNNGDEITVNVDNKVIKGKIYGVSQFQSNKEVYTSFEFLKENGIESENFNGIYSNMLIDHNGILAITDKEEFKNNFEQSVDMMKSASILQALIGIILGCFIISVTSNTLIKDNRKNLRLMMALGYTQKEINKSCLKAYTPFVVVGFIFSIPNSFFIMKMMFNEVAKSSGMSYPVRFDFMSIAISFVVTMIVYYFTINKDKKKLNKISLNEIMQ